MSFYCFKNIFTVDIFLYSTKRFRFYKTIVISSNQSMKNYSILNDTLYFQHFAHCSRITIHLTIRICKRFMNTDIYFLFLESFLQKTQPIPYVRVLTISFLKVQPFN